MTQSDKANAAAETASPRIDPASVVGWGVDADPENDPTWPMRDRSRDDGPGLNWERPPVQHPDVEILQSVEHLRQPASVGTSTPPHGLSGVIRRKAFRFSESQWGHWLLLMLADRVDSIEGIFSDLKRGKRPRPFQEMGVARPSARRMDS
ncbi:hypothetical protein [Phenylobacterium sp.]|uniref:hypothetical protein n=1 Tax=Phenylobacterium sp. TaxID=1871053 RepID=UPI002F958B42